MSLLGLNPNLTHGLGDFHAQAAITHRGQAHFAGTGPAGAVCSGCVYYGGGRANGRQPCQKFRALTGKAGPLIPKDAVACKYFEPTGARPLADEFGIGGDA